MEKEINVTRVTPDIAGNNALVAQRGAEALGWSGRFLDRNARGCKGSGVCAFGCPTGAKQHTGQTYMKWAQEAGAQLHSGTKVRRVEGRTVMADGLRVDADRIVVATGHAAHPGLLRRSGVRHPELGRNLSIHPATAAWALMDEEVDMGRGVPQSYCVDEFADEGILFEGVAGPPDYMAMAVPYVGARHRELMLALPQRRAVRPDGLRHEPRPDLAAPAIARPLRPQPPRRRHRREGPRAPRRAAVRRRRAQGLRPHRRPRRARPADGARAPAAATSS